MPTVPGRRDNSFVALSGGGGGDDGGDNAGDGGGGGCDDSCGGGGGYGRGIKGVLILALVFG